MRSSVRRPLADSTPPSSSSPDRPATPIATAGRDRVDLRSEIPVADRGESLGIPTWFYGHEPPNVFATWCAKYFENSVREDGLLALANAGVVFMPGGAGTMQEVFQDACGNHYAEGGAARPMVFFGVDEWTDRLPAVPLLRRLAGSREYAELIVVTDDPAEVVAAVGAAPTIG